MQGEYGRKKMEKKYKDITYIVPPKHFFAALSYEVAQNFIMQGICHYMDLDDKEVLLIACPLKGCNHFIQIGVSHGFHRMEVGDDYSLTIKSTTGKPPRKGGSSVKIDGPCKAHFFIKNGEVI